MADEGDDLLSDYFGPLEPTWTTDAESAPDRRVIVVPVTKLYGDPLFGKPRGVKVDQGVTAWVKLPLYSATTGAPVVFARGNYSEAPIVSVRVVENSGADGRVWEPDAAAELSSDGRYVSFPVPPEVSNLAGVYRAQVRVADGNNLERARDEILVLVDRGLWTTDGGVPADRGPPTFAEVRLATRDHPAANRLLGEYEFDAAEIGFAVTSAVQRFNNEFPPLPRAHALTTIRVPGVWRRQVLVGTLAYLFETAANYFRRGNLPYQAAGLAVNDLAKDKEYQAMVKELRAEFERWVKLTRMSISIAAAHGSIGSGYPLGATY